jgi:Tetratricopeptide Repeats-Sensor
MSDDLCFVVMGFGEKCDLATGRKLDLDKAYKHLVRPAVEAAGLKCMRSDEVRHTGVIDVPMYQYLLEARVVVADLSTANANAMYELGVRHALRPFSTVVIAESRFQYPFDVNHVVIQRYEHLGTAIDVEEAERFRAELTQTITTVLQQREPAPDSPVYVFLSGLVAPYIGVLESPSFGAREPPGTRAPTTASGTEIGLSLRDHLEAAKRAKAADPPDWDRARHCFALALELTPHDPYVIQQLALATYKAGMPTVEDALRAAKSVLAQLEPEISNDSETLGIWGAIHKHEWDASKDRSALETAIDAYRRGFVVKDEPYDGINFAFLLNERALVLRDDQRAEAIADFVNAERVRHRIIESGKDNLAAAEAEGPESKYWMQATMAEALYGVGRRPEALELLDDAEAPEPWMLETTRKQLERLGVLLEASPLGAIADSDFK